MAHLVEPITTTTSLAECHRQVNTAHDYLATHGIKAFEDAAAHTRLDDWGATVKRVRVTLPDEGRRWCRRR